MIIFDGLAGIFTDTFGEAVTVTPDGGSAREITGIYRRESDVSLELNGLGGVRADRIVVRADKADVSDLAQGDEVIAGGITHTISDMEPDSHDMVTLVLSEV